MYLQHDESSGKHDSRDCIAHESEDAQGYGARDHHSASSNTDRSCRHKGWSSGDSQNSSISDEPFSGCRENTDRQVLFGSDRWCESGGIQKQHMEVLPVSDETPYRVRERRSSSGTWWTTSDSCRTTILDQYENRCTYTASGSSPKSFRQSVRRNESPSADVSHMERIPKTSHARFETSGGTAWIRCDDYERRQKGSTFSKRYQTCAEQRSVFTADPVVSNKKLDKFKRCTLRQTKKRKVVPIWK